MRRFLLNLRHHRCDVVIAAIGDDGFGVVVLAFFDGLERRFHLALAVAGEVVFGINAFVTLKELDGIVTRLAAFEAGRINNG